MELMDVIRKRMSIRKYRPDPVPDEDIEYILEAARLAPSWTNSQCWKFIIIKDEKAKQQLAEAGNKWISKAPVIIAACADPTKSGIKHDQQYYMLDIGITMEHLILAATERGLGTCWIGWFDEVLAKKALDIPKNIRLVATTPLGYPDESPEPRGRKALAEIICYDIYSF